MIRWSTESLTAHVPLEIAVEIRTLAEDGNRSVSREVCAALRAHVAREASASGAVDRTSGSRATGAAEEGA